MDKSESLKKAVVVDFDGTLVMLPVDWAVLKQKVKELFLSYGVEASVTPLTQGIRDALAQVADPELVQNNVYEIFEEMEHLALEKAELIPGARELLSGLAEKGYAIIIYSANSTKVVEQGLAKFGLKADRVVGRQGSAMLKADPRSLPLLRQQVVDFELVHVIGDSDTDRIVADYLQAPFSLVHKENLNNMYHAILEQL